MKQTPTDWVLDSCMECLDDDMYESIIEEFDPEYFKSKLMEQWKTKLAISRKVEREVI
jgi:hypothetical protein